VPGLRGTAPSAGRLPRLIPIFGATIAAIMGYRAAAKRRWMHAALFAGAWLLWVIIDLVFT